MAGRPTRETRWILVSDASRARLYEVSADGQEFTMLQAFSHESSRARVRDLMADAQGRKPVGTAGGMGLVHAPGAGTGSVYLGRPGAAPDTDPKEVEAEKFARELSDALERGLNEHAYDKLVLIAPPHFLGLMRGTLPTQVAKRLETTLDKDITWLDPPEIERRLRDLLAA